MHDKVYPHRNTHSVDSITGWLGEDAVSCGTEGVGLSPLLIDFAPNGG
jgi:hypothetical protein